MSRDSFHDAVSKLLGHIEASHTQVTKLHVFAAVPVCAAIILGRSVGWGFHPNLVVYDHVGDGYERASGGIRTMKLLTYFDDFMKSTVNINDSRLRDLNERVGTLHGLLSNDSDIGSIVLDKNPQGSWATPDNHQTDRG